MYTKIAIDVGGTHTDAVLIAVDTSRQLERIIDTIKIQTHGADVTGSVLEVMGTLLDKNQMKAADIDQIQLGTTHFVNALKQRRNLQKVAAIRLALPASDLVPPFAAWPREVEELGQNCLYDEMFGYTAIIHGGNEYNGAVSTKLSRQELGTVAREIMARGIKHVVLSAPFSEKFPEMERLAKRELQQLLSDEVEISLSQEIGRGNILQRENAAILNMSLREVSQQIFTDLQQRLGDAGYNAPLLITRNDGSCMPVGDAIVKPFLAYSSGQINSIRGAGILSKVKNAIVVDVGGTTTDVGILKDGIPHMVNLNSKEEGIDVKLTCAHQTSIALGGGSIIDFLPDGEINVNEQSVGHKLETESFYGGGDNFTVTDLALALGRLNIPDVDMDAFQKRLEHSGITDAQLKAADEIVHQKVARLIDRIRIDNKPLPILLVGGGAHLIDETQLRRHLVMSYQEITVPAQAEVANAVGASTGKIMVIYSIECPAEDEREKDAAREQAKQAAILRGVISSTISMPSEHIEEVTYSQDRKIKFTVVVEGILDLKQSHRVVEAMQGEQKKIPLDKYIQEDGYERAIVEHSSVRASDNSQDDNTAHYLTPEDVQLMAIGTGYLGSGGGGDASIGEVALLSAMRNGVKVPLVDMNELDNDDYVIMVGYGGMPSVLNERLLSSLSGPAAMKTLKQMLEAKLEEQTGVARHVNIAAAVPIEIGGANGLLSALQAAVWGIPIANADTMGRAFPLPHMNTANIYGKIDHHQVALASDQGLVVQVSGDDLKACEPEIFGNIAAHGGAMFVALMPMKVIEAKQHCLLNTFSSAIKIGRMVRDGLQRKAPLEAVLSEALEDTIYDGCEKLFSGTIVNYSPISDGHHNSGSIVIRDLDGDLCEVYFKNECLLATKNGKPIAITPDIIALVNPDTGLAIGSSADYHVGLRVEVIRIGAPEALKTPKALAILRDEGIQALADESVSQASTIADEAAAVADSSSTSRIFSDTNFGGRSTMYRQRSDASAGAESTNVSDNNSDNVSDDNSNAAALGG